MSMEKALSPARYVISDVLAIAFILVVPALSHLTSVPFYLLDPMRIAALGVLLATRDWKNSLALAVALPIISMLISGHPVFPKCLLISVELGTNILLLVWFARIFGSRMQSNPGMATGLAVFLSIIASKGIYYLLKLAVISFGWLQMDLVSTAIWMQLIVALAISIVFALVARKMAF